MKNRWGALLAVIAIAPVLMGSGGFNPPPPGSRIVGPAVTATIVLDPHDNGATEGQASIRLSYKKESAGAVFTVPFTGYFSLHGCDASLTPQRFEGQLLTTYVPEELVNQLFASIGITVTGANLPVITDTSSATCTPDPENMLATPNPGTLSFDAIIQFAVPGKK